jgi:hypothetical protein
MAKHNRTTSVRNLPTRRTENVANRKKCRRLSSNAKTQRTLDKRHAHYKMGTKKWNRTIANTETSTPKKKSNGFE